MGRDNPIYRKETKDVSRYRVYSKRDVQNYLAKAVYKRRLSLELTKEEYEKITSTKLRLRLPWGEFLMCLVDVFLEAEKEAVLKDGEFSESM